MCFIPTLDVKTILFTFVMYSLGIVPRYDYTNAYEDIANIIFPQSSDRSASGVMIYIDLSKSYIILCRHRLSMFI